MISITLNGKPFTPETLEDAIVQAMADGVREKLGAIRHPETGEFPTIAITGNSIDDLRVQVEGSPELLKLVQERLAEGEDGGLEPVEVALDGDDVGPTTGPEVFLSYASEDRALAERIAHALQANGISTWWDNWCIYAGDSIRQRIDEGIGNCTHFVVLLTPHSIVKPWVNQEIDAGLVRKLGDRCRFIPLRSDLPASKLPSLLSGMLSPQVDAEDFNISQLINDIHGLIKKPALGPAPASISSAKTTQTGYSPAATALAKFFVERTEGACKFDPHLPIEDVATELNLSKDDILDAAHELHGMVECLHDLEVYAEPELFVRFDNFWKPWSPSEDAVRVAALLLNDDSGSMLAPGDLAGQLGWEPRRMNPALAYLANRKLARTSEGLNSQPWLLLYVCKADATRRFVKSRQ
jgi:TIR domain-containing protein